MLKPSLPLKVILLLSFTCLAISSFSQEDSKAKKSLNLSGTINANSNGFSLVPTFSLGKPAVQTGFNISGNGRLSLHPQIWYSILDYKPWSFIFIWRYKLIDKEKFDFYLGTHAPGINFQSAVVTENNIQKNVIKARRFYPALELTSVYNLREEITLGFYAILGRGIEKEIANNNTFLSFRMNFSKIHVSSKLYLKINPQIYYLRIDSNDGIYAAGGITLAHEKWPVSFSTMMNREVVSSIEVSKFEWNVGMSYTFAKSFVEK